MRILFFLIPVFFFANVKAQQKQIDSLILLASKAGHDSTRLNIYEKICEICDTKDNLKYGRIADSLAERLVNAAKNEKEKEKFIRKRLKAFFVIGIYFDELGQIDSLEKYRIKSVEIAKTTNNPDLVNAQSESLADMYMRENQYTKAMTYFTDELKKAEKAKDRNQILFALGGVSRTYSRMHNSQKALDYEFKKLKIIQDDFKDSTDLAYTYFNIGLQYYNLHNCGQAISFYLRAYSILEKKLTNRDKSYYLFQLAIAYNELNNSAEARNIFLKALDIVNQLKSPVIKGVVYSEIGQTYFYEKQLDKALEYKLKGIALINNNSDGDAFLPNLTTGQVYLQLKQYALAEKHVLVAKKIAEGRQDIHNQKAVMKTLADIYNAKGDAAKANGYLVTYYQLKDSLDKMKNTEELLYKELNYENEKNEARLLAEQEKKDTEAQNQKRKQSLVTYFVAAVLLIVLVFLFFVFRSLRTTKRQKQIIEIKESETQKQKHLVEEKQKEILDSITYAQRLQQAILPPQDFIAKNFKDSFILYKPKDIVAGDFYWAEQIGNLFFIAAADCTGHGVPGAVVSVVCSNALNRTVKEFGLADTGKILDKTRELVIETFEKSNAEVKDGMDISLLCIDREKLKLFWSGANNPLWYVQDNTLTEIKADKQPIGKSYDTGPFKTNAIEYKAGTTFYLFTDGLADQFGGPKGKKFKYKQFEELLVAVNGKPMAEQSTIIDLQFESWKGTLEQVDDVCVIGIKI